MPLRIILMLAADITNLNFSLIEHNKTNSSILRLETQMSIQQTGAQTVLSTVQSWDEVRDVLSPK